MKKRITKKFFSLKDLITLYDINKKLLGMDIGTKYIGV
jgi:hypothetical protein